VEWEFFEGGLFNFIMLLVFDWVRLRFGGFVLLISGMVILYSGVYIEAEVSFSRFIILVALFVLSMALIIFSPNLIRILLGWDGLGLVSYCLVIFYQNVKSLNAGLLTILSNRVGDVALLLRIAWLFREGSWGLFSINWFISGLIGSFITVLVVLAAITKSAQIPFSAWLPAAIAAPTPVSALVHSSTLVTAGVYLIIRFREVLGVRKVLLIISVLTIFMSGLGANYEIDLKKIIALSTLSQLGVIIISLSLGMVELAYFHLLTHALFKSLLFLCAGVFIHGSFNTQDVRLLGVMGVSGPVTSFYFIGCSLSLCGFPFLSGFYSKDLILETFIGSLGGPFLLVLVILGIVFTITYSIRLFFLSIFNRNGGLVVKSGVESF